ncbi:hypothetical protein [Paenibacillus sp. FSL W7-1332]|uniref:hypothetical protein n=1 Tax=Paenibacillus sp. FSL W7-1332 TaxID=2921702 RepID=UPI0030D36988
MIKGAGAKQAAPEYKMDLGAAVPLGIWKACNFPASTQSLTEERVSSEIPSPAATPPMMVISGIYLI